MKLELFIAGQDKVLWGKGYFEFCQRLAVQHLCYKWTISVPRMQLSKPIAKSCFFKKLPEVKCVHKTLIAIFYNHFFNWLTTNYDIIHTICFNYYNTVSLIHFSIKGKKVFSVEFLNKFHYFFCLVIYKQRSCLKQFNFTAYIFIWVYMYLISDVSRQSWDLTILHHFLFFFVKKLLG